MSCIKNTAYIVGGDHHNGLGLARILGINGIKVNSLVIGDIKRSFLAKSKYVSDCKVFKTEKEAFDYLLTIKKDSFKGIIIPYSDTAALELDNRLNEFKDKFYVPSINEEQGKIAWLMDKQNQYDFAVNSGITMAYTVTTKIQDKTHPELEKMPYPCIIKPVISAEGHKRDISICQNRNELLKAIAKYKKLGYFRALVQEYLKIDYEIDVFGCILRQKPYICQIPTRTIRSWLPQGGTNSFSRIITDKGIVEECRKIIESINKIGFYGLYDIELFVVNGKIILNEINLRNSGDVYMGIAQKYYYPYAWVCDLLSRKVTIKDHPYRQDYTMTECADIRNVLAHNVSLRKWIKEFLNCKDYALRFSGDMRPAFNRYLYYIKQFLRGKRL